MSAQPAAEAAATVPARPPLVNPLREGLRLERTPQPAIMVIFGATGDLTRRKLIPALYNLALERLLPPGFTVIGFARRPWNDETFREEMLAGVNQFSRRRPVQPAVWQSFAQGLFYHQSTFEDPEGYRTLVQRMAQIDRERGTGGNRVFYLATPPSDYPVIVQQLGAIGQGRAQGDEPGWRRIIVEKPFGRDLATARELNRQLTQVFSEQQVYRIDHYLGKETVQNLLVFRFANGIFEPIWNRRYVDHIQITVAESVGVEGRGGYYEEAGALRDMVANHMLQLLSLVAMEPPWSIEADAVRDEKVKTLRAIRPMSPSEVADNTLRGQYGPGWLGGERVPGYREEPNVAPDSITETYVALRLFVENWRWAGVPFYLRTGKRLPKRATEIALQFRPAPLSLFSRAAAGTLEPNVLAIRIQPDEGISLKFSAKVPGPIIRIRPVNMDFLYGTSFSVESPDAYERLLLDCLLGDSTLFTRSDEVEAAWTIVTAILEGWAEMLPPAFPNYEAGTWGPDLSHAFIGRDGRAWRRL